MVTTSATGEHVVRQGTPSASNWLAPFGSRQARLAAWQADLWPVVDLEVPHLHTSGVDGEQLELPPEVGARRKTTPF